MRAFDVFVFIHSFVNILQIDQECVCKCMRFERYCVRRIREHRIDSIGYGPNQN